MKPGTVYSTILLLILVFFINCYISSFSPSLLEKDNYITQTQPSQVKSKNYSIINIDSMKRFLVDLKKLCPDL